MFTGLIQGLGEIISSQDEGGQRRFWIQPLFRWAEIEDGESICVNGVCLSVERHAGTRFSTYASAETLSKTTLARLQKGDKVNLERALELGQRLGGHIISGHVDCVATLLSSSRAGESIVFRLGFPRAFAAQIVPKGSVALDGISLTVNECSLDSFTVNIIPDSQHRTNIPSWRPGCGINMETDIIGKYVLRDAQVWRSQGSASTPPQGSSVNRDFLSRHGFI